jgi:predicted P-loop ATPase
MAKAPFPRVKKPSSTETWPEPQQPEWDDEYKPDPKVEAMAKSLDRKMSDLAYARELERKTYEDFHAKKAKAETKEKAKAKGEPPPHPGGDGPTEPPKKRRLTKQEATELNVWKALRETPELYEGGLFKLDTFSGRMLLMHPIPVPGVTPPTHWKPSDVTDIQISRLMVWLQANGFVKVSVSRTGHAVDMEAERNAFSSAKKWLLSLPEWDKEKRLDHFWIDVCGAKMGEEGATEAEVERRWKYLSATARCFFISIVARIMRPGCKADFSPVLEGPQGTLKSTLLRIIAVNDDWFSDCMPRDLGNKDARSHLAGKLIVELAEMHQMKATQVDTLKGFLTVQEDKFRPSYGRLDVTLKRQCVFVGTTNRSDYFGDETGNRRFWPIACGKIDLDMARELMPQLYAEALAAFLADEPWWLPPDIEDIAGLEQDERITSDPWDETIANLVDKAREVAGMHGEQIFWMSSSVVLGICEADLGQRDAGKLHRVALTLRKLGGKNMRLPRDGNIQKRGFRFITSLK